MLNVLVSYARPRKHLIAAHIPRIFGASVRTFQQIPIGIFFLCLTYTSHRMAQNDSKSQSTRTQDSAHFRKMCFLCMYM